jgi:hypothetical protein
MFNARLFRLVEFITFFSCATGSNCVLYDRKHRRFYVTKRTRIYSRIIYTILAFCDVFAILQTVRLKLTGSNLFNMCSTILLPTQLALIVLSIILIYPEETTLLMNQLVIHFVMNFERMNLQTTYSFDCKCKWE